MRLFSPLSGRVQNVLEVCSSNNSAATNTAGLFAQQEHINHFNNSSYSQMLAFEALSMPIVVKQFLPGLALFQILARKSSKSNPPLASKLS